jgi:hypothetical protein
VPSFSCSDGRRQGQTVPRRCISRERQEAADLLWTPCQGHIHIHIDTDPLCPRRGFKIFRVSQRERKGQEASSAFSFEPDRLDHRLELTDLFG